MTRIAAPESEAALSNIAESGTAAHVERVVAKYRRVERSEDARRAHGLYRHRSVRYCSGSPRGRRQCFRGNIF